MVSEKALKEFKAIWEEEFGQPISDDFAMKHATTILTFFDAVYRPIKKEWIEKEEKLEEVDNSVCLVYDQKRGVYFEKSKVTLNHTNQLQERIQTDY